VLDMVLCLLQPQKHNGFHCANQDGLPDFDTRRYSKWRWPYRLGHTHRLSPL